MANSVTMGANANVTGVTPVKATMPILLQDLRYTLRTLRRDIGFAALRGGTVVGDHSVIFAGPAERIELSHRAEDRMIFARGALKAALWARGQKPGLYSMADVLGLKDF